MHNNTKKSDGDIPVKVLELIPWYAIGKLSVDDQALFEKALETYPSLENLLEQEQQIIQKVSTDHSLLEKSAIAAPEERLKSVFNMIDIDESQHQAKTSNTVGASGSLIEKFKSVLGLTPSSNGAPQYARAASVAVLVLSVAVLTAFVAPLFSDKSDFVPASAVNQANTEKTLIANTSNTTLLVGFNGTSTALANNDVLKDRLLKIETVPNKEGIFQISFKQALSNDEVKQTIDALLKQKDIIWFAGEAF